MDRRTLLKVCAALGLAGAGLNPALARPIGPRQAFDYAWLKGHANTLANQPYKSHEGEVPKSLQRISWDDYQKLRFKPEHALWRNQESLFQAQLFHLGLFFQSPVHIYEVVDGQAQEIGYDRDYFDYDGDRKLGSMPEDLGYAGFRLHFHNNFKLDTAAFLGASYFRAVGESMQYGLSARGLAINTVVPGKTEEFPNFTAFWLERPQPGSTQVRVYALLDSPSTTGAYAFTIEPGSDMVMDIDVALYPRKPIDQVGIAPLTSMYQVGENHRRRGYDWRPEIHDSDGLSIHNGAGEWLWRPLVNPRTLQVNSFLDNQPRGFGLLQRDRDFDHYQDDGVFYEKRPSAWVKPSGNWGEGAVMLVEIPTDDETFDNIVAFWNPKEPLQPGQEYLYSYRLTWGDQPPARPEKLAHVVATRTGLGGVVGRKREYFSWRFAVDFSGGSLSMLASDAKVEPVITVSRGKVEVTSARPLHAVNGYRAMFDLVPDDSEEPIDIRMVLKQGDQVLTETWLYQYRPPAVADRQLY